MHNQITINYIYTNYKKIVRSCGRSRGSNYSYIEDALSKLTIRLLHKDYDIQDPAAFVRRAVSGEIANRRTIDKKYFEAPDSFFQLLEDVDNSETVDYELKVRKINEALPILTAGQQGAITNFLKYGLHTKCPGNTETQKTQFRNAINKLRELIK